MREKGRVREKLIEKFEKSDLILSRISSEDEDTDRVLQRAIDEDFTGTPIYSSEITPREGMDFGRQQGQRKFQSNNSSKNNSKTYARKKGTRTDSSSFYETDNSILAINRKVEEMKQNKPRGGTGKFGGAAVNRKKY